MRITLHNQLRIERQAKRLPLYFYAGYTKDRITLRYIAPDTLEAALE